jgi:SAM-dependent methyltransferase
VKKVFIGWSGKVGRTIAESLSEDFLKQIPSLDTWISSINIDIGKRWLSELESALSKADQAIICVTPCTVGAPWINFEAGITYGRLKRIFIVTIGEDIPSTHPFSAIQVIDGTKLENLVKLAKSLVADEYKNFAETAARQNGQVWIDKCNQIIGSPATFKSIGKLLQSLSVATRKIEESSGIFANSLFHFVVDQSLSSMAVQLNGVLGDYSVSSDLYPEYLAAIQKTYGPRVLAVALVEQEEFFWRGQLGRTVLETIRDRSSERVFVLATVAQLIDFFPTILQHAKRYKVYVLSLQLLIEREPRYAHDFSILMSTKEKMLATYSPEGVHRRNISFSIDDASLRDHEAAYYAIRQMANEVNAEDFRQYTEKQIAALWPEPEMSPSERKTVEMSTYIPIHEYDQHEEEHAYYQEMMSKMIEFISTSPRRGPNMRVLEFGAGTGIFTSKLAVKEDVAEIVAVECDWSCYDLLRHKFRTVSKVKAQYEDSRLFSPAGDFDVIVSSFADHHIRPSDKRQYFRNVKNNLRESAIFVVGDEFLPEHNPEEKNERDAALDRYHNHIIEIAESKGQLALAELERKALNSGKKTLIGHGGNVGDYKVSCSQYEQMLKQAGFSYERVCIGPLDRDDLGGVFVYRCRL